MNVRPHKFSALAAGFVLLFALPASASTNEFNAELLQLQHEWAQANYQATTTNERRSAFAIVVEHAAELTRKYPSEVEAVAWEGIVLSTYAGEVSAMGAMKYAKAARNKLLQAEEMNPRALGGGIYASLGALYSKVPGGFFGFGDDDRARDYFTKALEVDANNIDNNYFYGEFLIDQGEHSASLRVLSTALNAEATPSRPVFDAGRRAEIRELISTAEAD